MLSVRPNMSGHKWARFSGRMIARCFAKCLARFSLRFVGKFWKLKGGVGRGVGARLGRGVGARWRDLGGRHGRGFVLRAAHPAPRAWPCVEDGVSFRCGCIRSHFRFIYSLRFFLPHQVSPLGQRQKDRPVTTVDWSPRCLREMRASPRSMLSHSQTAGRLAATAAQRPAAS